MEPYSAPPDAVAAITKPIASAIHASFYSFAPGIHIEVLLQDNIITKFEDDIAVRSSVRACFVVKFRQVTPDFDLLSSEWRGQLHLSS